jgi:hypothetical protein
LARLADVSLVTLELPDGATVGQLFTYLGETQAGLAPALPSALPVVAGSHVDRARVLRPGEEVALLIPVAGG